MPNNILYRYIHTHKHGLSWRLSSKESARNAGVAGSIPGSGRSLAEGMATHSSVLAWRATRHRVTKSQTRRKRLSTHIYIYTIPPWGRYHFNFPFFRWKIWLNLSNLSKVTERFSYTESQYLNQATKFLNYDALEKLLIWRSILLNPGKEMAALKDNNYPGITALPWHWHLKSLSYPPQSLLAESAALTPSQPVPHNARGEAKGRGRRGSWGKGEREKDRVKKHIKEGWEKSIVGYKKHLVIKTVKFDQKKETDLPITISYAQLYTALTPIIYDILNISVQPIINAQI